VVRFLLKTVMKNKILYSAKIKNQNTVAGLAQAQKTIKYKCIKKLCVI